MERIVPHTISRLEDHLGYWLRFVSNHVSHAFGEKVAARGVSVPEWVMLRELFDGMASPSEIAGRMGMTRGAVSKITDRLVAKELVTRTPGKHDGRFQTLTLTRKGRDLVPALAALADDNDEEFFGQLDKADRKKFADAMRDIVRRRALKIVPID